MWEEKAVVLLFRLRPIMLGFWASAISESFPFHLDALSSDHKRVPSDLGLPLGLRLGLDHLMALFVFGDA